MTRAKTLALVVCSIATGLVPGGTARAQVGRSAGVRDANLASEKDLLAVPSLTPAIVKAIVSGRPFASVTSLDALLRRSLGPDALKQVHGKLFVPINLNAGSREEILSIPGVGDRMLREFLEYRPYKTLSQFRRETGKYVDDKELARLEQYVFVPVNLNTASDADILSIPGLGQRMLHEFKEYRPYKNIEQFRREIGKYVDKNELARLERYVTID